MSKYIHNYSSYYCVLGAIENRQCAMNIGAEHAGTEYFQGYMDDVSMNTETQYLQGYMDGVSMNTETQ